jgi:hypothetical protein
MTPPLLHPSRPLKWAAALTRALLWAVLGVWLLVGLTWGAVHFFIVPRIGDWRGELEALATNLRTTTREGDSRNVMGLIRGSETPEEVVIFDGKEKKKVAVAEIDERTQLKQSSMPEGLAATLSPNEFLDVIAFLKSRTK